MALDFGTLYLYSMKEVAEIYNRVAKKYLDQVHTSSYNAYLERPAMLKILGQELEDLLVLDVGCASGFYYEKMTALGARVTGVDISSEMVKALKEKWGEDAPIYQGDIAGECEFLTAPAYDVVLASLSLHYIEDWHALFAKFASWMPSGGRLIFSTHHPLDDFDESPSGNYFKTEWYKEVWPSYKTEFLYTRRPFGAMVGAILQNGFALKAVVEPLPVPELEAIDSVTYERLSKTPPFICFECVKH